MSYFSGDAEPFEEIQGNRAAKASPDELKMFYESAQRSDIERKLSKRKSSSGSIWSRKSLKRTSTSQSQSPQSPRSPQSPASGTLRKPPPSLQSPSTTSLARPPPSISEHGSEWSDNVPPMPSRSLVPETLNELPSWYRDSQHYTTRYNMHNPVGPKWYQNYHLIPPSSARPTGPPPVFSTSFPPMASGSRSEQNLIPSPTKSPQPTPNSSQIRVDDVANPPRSRKTSQTAHDNVDLMDVSDPWGTPWHHESPYDVGKSNSPVSLEENPSTNPRSRTSSVTAPLNRNKTITPSPLSQSTSAVHLNVPQGPPPTRKLSKRRTVGIFGRHTTSAPASPVENLNSRMASPTPVGPPSSFAPVVETGKKDRRSSVLGRIAKRFSLSRKPPVVAMQVVRQPSPQKRQPSPEKPHVPEPINHAGPPPLLHQDSSFVVVSMEPEAPPVEDDRSSLSLDADAAYRMGRLMVANPDPGSPGSTPAQAEMSLPLEEDTERTERTVQHEHGSSDGTETVSPHVDTQVRLMQSPEPLVRDSKSPEPAPSVVKSPEIVDQRQMTPRSETPPPPPPAEKPPPPAEKPPPPAEKPSPPAERPPRSPEKRPTAPERAPPAPEKPVASFVNDHRFERPTSGVRTPVERISAPQSNGIRSSSSTAGERVKSYASSRVVEKPQPLPPSPPSPKLPAVPFPADYGPAPAAPSRGRAPQLPMMTADISPLSTSSILVNPPTPYNPETLMPEEPEPVPPPVPSKRASRDPSPNSVAVVGRETETFKLIRSASGTVYASTETIRAAGEQWEVVESSKRDKNKSQDRDSESRREQRRQARAEREVESEQTGRSERKRRSAEASGAQTFPRAGSEHQHRLGIPDAFSSQDESRQRARKSERKAVDPRLDKPQPPPPGSSRPLERNPSNAARPTSEVPPAADMNQMRAREAWDMDRLWKARSLNGMEPNAIEAPPPMPPKPVNGKNGSKHDQPAVHGSSHTAFMMSAPFQQQPPQIYHSMPPAPPSARYPAGYAPTNSYPNTNRSDRASNSISPPPLAPLNNPLPEPPRESPYQPSPLALPEHWAKYASVTPAH